MGGYIHCSCIGCLPTAVAAVGNVVAVGTFVGVDVVETVDNVDTKLHCYSQVAGVDLLMLKVANLWEEYQSHPRTELVNQLLRQLT